MHSPDNLELITYLCYGDKLQAKLYLWSRKSKLRTAIIAVSIYGLLFLVLGFTISYNYRKSGDVFLAIFDIPEIISAFFMFLIFLPLTWVFYTYQPVWLLNVFQELHRNGVISKDIEIDEIVREDTLKYSKKKVFFWAIVLFFATAGTILWMIISSKPDSPFFFGQPNIWWRINKGYFYFIWLPLSIFLIYYMILWILLRQFDAGSILGCFFKKHKVKPIPFHPDRVNGLSVVGKYAIILTWFSFLYGTYISFIIFWPMLFGQQINFNIITFPMACVFLISVPLFLLRPVWEAQNNMTRIRNEVLSAIAKEIEGLALKNDMKSIDLMKLLVEKYKILEKEYQRRPFKKLSLSPIISFISPQYLTYLYSIGVAVINFFSKLIKTP